MENEQDETTVKKDFSSLPVHLRELVLSKTGAQTRVQVFQINNRLREWVLKEGLFGEDLNEIRLHCAYGAQIVPRYGYPVELDVPIRYVFKVVRRCWMLYFGVMYWELDLASVFPRLQSVNYLEFGGTNPKRLPECLKNSDVEVTDYYDFHESWRRESDLPWTNSNIDENVFQFIEKHLKRCMIVRFGKCPLEKLFECLGTQHISQAIFECESYGWQRNLEMILKNGIPSLHPDPAIQLIIVFRTDGSLTEPGVVYKTLLEIFNIISEGINVLIENEAIKNKFLVSYKNVGGSLNNCNRQFFGLKRKFDEKRNLIFLFYKAVERTYSSTINIHIKFEPIEK